MLNRNNQQTNGPNKNRPDLRQRNFSRISSLIPENDTEPNAIHAGQAGSKLTLIGLVVLVIMLSSNLLIAQEHCDCAYQMDVQPASNPCAFDFFLSCDAHCILQTTNWSFGDGTSSTIVNPTHVFPDNGAYQVCVAVVAKDLNNPGQQCVEQICEQLVVSQCDSCHCGSVPGFKYTLEDSCAVQFTDLTTANDCNTPVAWQWDFGDGSPVSNQQNPAHDYTNSGTYNICLTVTVETTGGLTYQLLFCQDVVIPSGCGGCPCFLNPDFSFVTNGCGADFSGSYLGGDCYDQLVWLWDFGDVQQAIGQQVSHDYATNGTYHVCLTLGGYLNDSLQCEKTVCKDVQIQNCGSLSCQLLDIQHICFNGASGMISVEGIGGVPPYICTDGTQTPPDCIFEPLAAGTYSITVQDSNGEVCVLQNIEVQQPESFLDGQVVVVQQPQCMGDASGSVSVIATGGIPPYKYELGQGIQLSPVFTNLEPGNYNLTITDALECEKALPFNFLPQFEVSGILVSKIDIPCAGQTGSAIVQGDNGTPQYTYSFNGGATQTSGYFSGLSPNNYQVLIKDANGCTGTLGFDIVQLQHQPVSIEPSAATICQTGGVPLVANPSGIYSWAASPSSGLSALSCTNCPNPIASPLSSTIYTVTRTDFNGCVSSASVTVQVDSILLFDLPDQAVCPGEAIALNPNHQNEDCYWTPQDGLDCTHCPNPTATVQQTTTYQVTCVIGLCEVTDTVTVFAEDATLTADFSFSLSTPSMVDFVATPAGLNSYVWDFGDPASGSDNHATGQMVQHDFTDPHQSYQVCLTAVGDCGIFTICHPVVPENCPYGQD